MAIEKLYADILSIWRDQVSMIDSSWVGFAIRFPPDRNPVESLKHSSVAEGDAESAASSRFVFFVERDSDALPQEVLDRVSQAGLDPEVRPMGRWVSIGDGDFRAGDGDLCAGGAIFAKFDSGNGLPGSAGALLCAKDGSRWLLTANHVITRNRIPERVMLDVPGPKELELGKDIRQVKIEPDNNRVDAAVVRLTVDTAKFADFFAPFGGMFGTNLTPVDPAQYIGLVEGSPRRVTKVGKSTRKTHGFARYVKAVVRIKIDEVSSGAGFEDLLIVEDLDENIDFAAAGDSGALVIDDETNGQPVGILIARATHGRLSIVAYLKTTLSELENAGADPFQLCTS